MRALLHALRPPLQALLFVPIVYFAASFTLGALDVLFFFTMFLLCVTVGGGHLCVAVGDGGAGEGAGVLLHLLCVAVGALSGGFWPDPGFTSSNLNPHARTEINKQTYNSTHSPPPPPQYYTIFGQWLVYITPNQQLAQARVLVC